MIYLRLNSLNPIDTRLIVVILCVIISQCKGRFSSFTRPSQQLILRDEDVCAGKPNPSFLPHPINCRYFIYCNDGNVNTVECPIGLAFNPDRPPCDLAVHVNCVDGTTGPFPTSTTTEMSTVTTRRTTTTTMPTTIRTTTTTKSTTTRPTTTRPTTTTAVPTTTTTTTTTTTLAPTTPTTTTIPTTIPTSTTTAATTTSTTPTTQYLPIDPNDPTVKCPDRDDPENVLFIASNRNCSRYVIC